MDAADPHANATILVVDDDAAVTAVFARVLSTQGYRVLVAVTAQEALREFDRNRPNAIIMDLRMPFIDGFGLLYRIRAREAQHHTPVLMVTGETALSEDKLKELSDLGSKLRYKPIQPSDLLAETRAMLQSD